MCSELKSLIKENFLTQNSDDQLTRERKQTRRNFAAAIATLTVVGLSLAACSLGGAGSFDQIPLVGRVTLAALSVGSTTGMSCLLYSCAQAFEAESHRQEMEKHL